MRVSPNPPPREDAGQGADDQTPTIEDITMESQGGGTNDPSLQEAMELPTVTQASSKRQLEPSADAEIPPVRQRHENDGDGAVYPASFESHDQNANDHTGNNPKNPDRKKDQGIKEVAENHPDKTQNSEDTHDSVVRVEDTLASATETR